MLQQLWYAWIKNLVILTSLPLQNKSHIYWSIDNFKKGYFKDFFLFIHYLKFILDMMVHGHSCKNIILNFLMVVNNKGLPAVRLSYRKILFSRNIEKLQTKGCFQAKSMFSSKYSGITLWQTSHIPDTHQYFGLGIHIQATMLLTLLSVGSPQWLMVIDRMAGKIHLLSTRLMRFAKRLLWLKGSAEQCLVQWKGRKSQIEN